MQCPYEVDSRTRQSRLLLLRRVNEKMVFEVRAGKRKNETVLPFYPLRLCQVVWFFFQSWKIEFGRQRRRNQNRMQSLIHFDLLLCVQQVCCFCGQDAEMLIHHRCNPGLSTFSSKGFMFSFSLVGLVSCNGLCAIILFCGKKFVVVDFLGSKEVNCTPRSELRLWVFHRWRMSFHRLVCKVGSQLAYQ